MVFWIHVPQQSEVKVLREKMKGCFVIDNSCKVNHCHVCKREQDDGGICQECTIGARDGWLWHLHNHEKTDGTPQHYVPQECNICASILEGMSKR